MPRYKLINLPQSVEACHDLIRILIQELNEYSEFVLTDGYEKEHIPSTDDNKIPISFCAPSGVNGADQSTAECHRDGGVGFMNFEGCGVPSTHGKEMPPYVKCPF